MSYAHGMHRAALHREPVARAKWRIAIYLLAMSMLEWAATAMLPEQARPAPWAGRRHQPATILYFSVAHAGVL